MTKQVHTRSPFRVGVVSEVSVVFDHAVPGHIQRVASDLQFIAVNPAQITCLH